MTAFGQLCLLATFIASGYAAFAGFMGWQRRYQPVEKGGQAPRANRFSQSSHLSVRNQSRFSTGCYSRLQWAGMVAGIAGFIGLTLVSAILAEALLTKNFDFAYVAQYSSRLLPWYYAVSVFWVGQAGSLLFWAWSVAALAMIYRFWPRRTPSPLTEPAFAILMAYQCFLVAIMVFGADPMQPSLTAHRDGGGLGPLLQHPAMLLHPPVVFLGYAGCALPFALVMAALLCGRLDATWVRDARPWALFAWAVQGIGILVGAYWAYEELGWGGYWAWDPVENGSLIPWLTATALIHAAMMYRHRGALKRTTVLLAVATFAACNFAAFLTRSGIFSSLHAFSHSPIGWMFLLLIVALTMGIAVFLVQRRVALAPDNPISGLFAKEGVIAASVFVLILLAAAVFFGTASMPLSQIFCPHQVLVGAGFYNGVLIPTSLLLLAAMAAAPLLRWGAPPEAKQRRALSFTLGAGLHAAGMIWLCGSSHPLAIAVVSLAAMTVMSLAASWALDARRQSSTALWRNVLPALRNRRRTYVGYAMHLALASLAIGVAGSSLGTQQCETTLGKGESIRWAGRDVRFVGVVQRQLPEKLVVQAELEVTAEGASPYTLRPAQEYHFLQNEWSTEVAIHSTWRDDFYTILHSGEGDDRIQLTLRQNPMMRWMWLSGWIMTAGAAAWFWPSRKSASIDSLESPVAVDRRGTTVAETSTDKQRRTAA